MMTLMNSQGYSAIIATFPEATAIEFAILKTNFMMIIHIIQANNQIFLFSFKTS